MTYVAWVLLALAGALHVYIFWLESFAWTAAGTRRTFGTTVEEAETTRQLAYNQGFYNLFLAVGAFAAVGFLAAGHEDVGLALAVAAAGSMVAAALVLVLSDRSKARAALTQGLLPALGLLVLVATR
jgi:putative membrane protein